MFIVAAILTFLLCYWIVTSIKEHLSPLSKIKEPLRYPFFYHFPYFLKAKDGITMILDWCEQFKDSRFFKLTPLVGTVDTLVVVMQSDDIKTILSKPDVFPRSTFLSKYIPLVGNGLINSSGDEHRRQKKFFSKAFTTSNMKNFLPVFVKHAKVLAKVWEEIVENEELGRNLTVINYFSNLSLDIIGELSFGYDFNCQKNENKFGDMLKHHLSGLLDLKRRLLLKLFPFLWYMPFGPAKYFKDSNIKMDKLLDQVVAARTKKIAEGTLTETEENDLLNMMMIAKEKSGEFTDQLIKDSAFTFLVAGNETTATALPGVLLYLAKYPLLQEKVREEINCFVNEAESRNLEELDKLIYTDAFIKESLRFFQPVPQGFRVSSQEYLFGDYLIPKGTGFLLPNLYIHEGERDFEKGKEFIPERFLANGLKHGTTFTFGYGPFSCIGKHFSLLEMKVTIVHLLKKFKFSIDPGCDKFYRKQLITLKIFPDLQIRVKNLL